MKYYGVIGISESTEDKPGVWVNHITEHEVFGDVLQNTRKWEASSQINDNISISNRFSILLDPFIEKNLQFLRYLTWMGSKWNITNINIAYPRVELTVGGLYNGE